MSAAREAFAMPMSPPPPSDIGSYSRSMHQHTKRLMEAASSPRRSSQSSSASASTVGSSTIPNGVPPSRSQHSASRDFGHQS